MCAVPARGGLHAAQSAEQRRFARSVRAEQTHEFAWLQSEIEAVEDSFAFRAAHTVANGEIVGDEDGIGIAHNTEPRFRIRNSTERAIGPPNRAVAAFSGRVIELPGISARMPQASASTIPIRIVAGTRTR